MINYENVMRRQEKAVFSLRSLYKQNGFAHYKMSKFEEYELYIKNKDFLVSDHVITFTDTSGKLMALKPDVTLSIIKNSKDLKSGVQRLCYDENVYRISNHSKSYREIMQAGIEVMGAVDLYNITMVLILALKSLEIIGENYILDIANMDIVQKLIGKFDLQEEQKNELVKCISEKNIHGIKQSLAQSEADEKDIEKLIKVTSCYGKLNEVIDLIKGIDESNELVDEIKTLEKISDNLGKLSEKVNLDLSIFDNMKYYNGIVFKGFVEGIPSMVLSGGQYDKLMKSMGKKSKAIGFAVYLDVIERMSEDKNEFDIDTVILYDENVDTSLIIEKINLLNQDGKSAIAIKEDDCELRKREVIDLRGSAK